MARQAPRMQMQDASAMGGSLARATHHVCAGQVWLCVCPLVPQVYAAQGIPQQCDKSRGVLDI